MLSPAGTEILAICVLAGIGLALAACVAGWFRRLPMRPTQATMFFLNVLLARILWRVQVKGRFAVGADQGAVIICNHISPIDPSFIYMLTNRVVHWMVAREFCEHPVMRWLLVDECASIPVSRGGIDTAATKNAIRYARNGELVGMFPEGRINTTDRVLLPGRPGAALIALKARVPVVPCYVWGSPNNGTPWGSFLMSARVKFVMGEPIDISEFYGREGERGVLEELTKRFLVEMARLAGQSDYQPELAGRFYKPGLIDD